VTYEIKVTNQGSSPGTNVRLVCPVPPLEQFISGSGATAVREEGGAVVTEPLASLAPKKAAVWRVVVKALQAGDVRFKIQLTSDQFEQPINEEESTQIY
jgi:uncharacterized repeat protein (TIGR01451 family)